VRSSSAKRKSSSPLRGFILISWRTVVKNDVPAAAYYNMEGKEKFLTFGDMIGAECCLPKV
jgi:hypothetical protein